MSGSRSNGLLLSVSKVLMSVVLLMVSLVAVSQAEPGKDKGKGNDNDSTTTTTSTTTSSTTTTPKVHGNKHDDDENDDDEDGNGKGKGHNKGAKTRLKLRLDDHNLDSGDDVTGTVTLQVREDHKWEGFSGKVTVLVDGDEETEVTTSSSDGKASVTVDDIDDGGHVMRVLYEGDDDHRSARHSQGFNLGDHDDEEDDD